MDSLEKKIQHFDLKNAIYQNNYKKVKKFLESGVDPNYVIYISGFEDVHLHSIINNNISIDILNLLLEYNADPNIQEDGWTCLLQAFLHNDLEQIKCLLKYGDNPCIYNPAVRCESGIVSVCSLLETCPNRDSINLINK